MSKKYVMTRPYEDRIEYTSCQLPALLTWLQPHERHLAMRRLKGQEVIYAPAAYFKNVPSSMSPLWETLSQQDERGWVVKTAPKHLMDKATCWFRMKRVPFEVKVL